MKKLIIFAFISISICIFLAVTYYFTTKAYQIHNSPPLYTSLILEAFKTLLTFTLITTGGLVLKTLIDQVLDKERSKQIKIDRFEETRRSIIKEFTQIFSEFYSIRKLYHSAFNHEEIYEKESSDYKLLIRQMLQKSVDLEGRYGALKVSAIAHFNLKRGHYNTKSVFELKNAILKTKVEDTKDIIRFRLDLLGEYYDEWRHAIEEKRKIEIDNEFWDTYNLLLGSLEHYWNI